LEKNFISISICRICSEMIEVDFNFLAWWAHHLNALNATVFEDWMHHRLESRIGVSSCLNGRFIHVLHYNTFLSMRNRVEAA